MGSWSESSGSRGCPPLRGTREHRRSVPSSQGVMTGSFNPLSFWCPFPTQRKRKKNQHNTQQKRSTTQTRHKRQPHKREQRKSQTQRQKEGKPNKKPNNPIRPELVFRSLPLILSLRRAGCLFFSACGRDSLDDP